MDENEQYLCARCGHDKSAHPLKKCAVFCLENNVTLLTFVIDKNIAAVYINGNRVYGRKVFAGEAGIWREISVSKDDIMKAINK